MFRPQVMVHVEVLLLQRDLDRVLRRLAAARLLHLHRVETAVPRSPSEETEGQLSRCRDLAGQLRRLLAELGSAEAPAKILQPVDLGAWESWAISLQRRLAGLRRRQEEQQRRRTRFAILALFLRRVQGLEGEVASLRRLRFSNLRLGLIPLVGLGEMMAAAGTGVYPLGAVGGRMLAAVLAVGEGRGELDRRLAAVQFTPVSVPALHGSFAAELARLRHLQAGVRRGLRRLERKSGALARENESLLRDRLRTIEAECRLLETEGDLGFTRHAVAIGGWVPKRRLAELKSVLQSACEGRFILRQGRARGDQTPVLLFNPRLLRPFQKILSVYGIPTYGEFEPTPLLALGFLVLFGMMFGDVGQGLVLLAAGVVLRRWTRFRDEGVIVAEVGVFAALFGLLFGSFFGREDLFPPLWFSPMQDIPRLMAAALILGAGLIVTGLLVRIWNGMRAERPAAVLTDRYGVAGLLFYAGSLGTALLVWAGIVPAVSLAWLALPLAAIFLHPFAAREGASTGERLAEGTVEVLETVLGYLANTFSFLRVAAFGLAHVGLFMAIFALADLVRAAPLGLVWVGLVHVIGNLVMLLLEGLIVSVQTVRLEFYEIFTKFFRGGGVEYRPFALDSGSERRQ